MKKIKDLIYDLKNDKKLYEKFLKEIGNIDDLENKSEKFLEDVIISFAEKNNYDISLEDIVENYFTDMRFVDNLQYNDKLNKISNEDLDLISGGLSVKSNAKILAAIQLLTMSAGMYSVSADTIAEPTFQSTGSISSKKVIDDISYDIKKTKNETDIISLLKENKNLPEFSEENPFNEVDAMVLCNLTYLSANMIPLMNEKNISDGITIEKWASDFKSNLEGKIKNLHNTDDVNDNLLKKFIKIDNIYGDMLKNREKLLYYASRCSRYKNIIVGNFVSKNQEFSESTAAEQFAAMTFTLKSGQKIVAFRGTDSTLTGWKEDFDLSYQDEVPAQKDSVKYLSDILNHYNGDKNIDIIGHSKGGHLALYSAFKSVESDNSVGSKIGTIYNLDGPGIRDDIYKKFSKETVKLINDKVMSVASQSSVISKIMCNDIGKCKLCIKSNSFNFLFQHDPLTWSVHREFYKKNNEKFVSEKQRPESELVEEMLSNFLKRAKKQDIKIFVNTVFNFLISKNFLSNSVNVYPIMISIFYKYAIQGKSVSQILSDIPSSSKTIVLKKEDEESITDVLNILSDEFFKSYWRRFDELNKSFEISEEIANQLKDYTGKNLSVSNVVKIAVKSYLLKKFRIYAIRNFFRKIFI